MKIVITTGIYPPQIGGPAQYALELSRALRDLGNQVTVKTYTHELKMPILIRHFYFFLKSLPAIAKADVVIALDTLSVGWPSVCAGNLVGTPVVIRTGGDFLWESYVERTGDLILLRRFYSENSETFDCEAFLGKLNRKERLIFKITRFTLSRTKKLIFSSDWQRKIWRKPYRLNVENTSIVENFYPKKRSLVGVVKNPEEFRIVAATRQLKWKNISSLRLIVEEINKKQTKKKVILDTKLLPYKENLERLATADLVILPSLGDISPNMIIDALSVNIPCVLTEENGINNRVGNCSKLIDPLNNKEIEESITELLDQEKYKLAKEKVSSFSFEHSWSQIAEEFLDIIFPRKVNETEHTKVTLMLSSDFNLLDRESAAHKRHIDYLKEQENILVGLIGRRPNNQKVLSTAHLEANNRLKVFSHNISNPVKMFFGVINDLRSELNEFPRKTGAKNLNITISCQDPFFTGLAGLFLRRKLPQATLLIQLHTDVTSPWYISHNIKNRIRFAMAGFILKRADKIRVVSERIKSGIIKEWGIEQDKIVIDSIKVDLEEFGGKADSAATEDLRRKYSKFSKIVLVASRLEPEKDIVTALKAWSRVVKDKHDWGLLIIGDGSQLEELELQAKSLGLDHNVIFEGWTDQLALYYKIVDLFLMTSLYEGYGLTLKEASLSGTKIVTTDVGIASELAKDGKTKIKIVEQRNPAQISQVIIESLTAV